jgi:hypothetical protein
MRTTCLMSELKRGDRFVVVRKNGDVSMPYELVTEGNVVAKVRHVHPSMNGEEEDLSVPGAMVRLLDN